MFGLLLGGAFAYFNFKVFSPSSAGHWMADNDRLTIVGYDYLLCIFLASIVIALYVVWNIAIAFLLRDVVAHSELHVLPLHPAKAGGLQPIGQQRSLPCGCALSLIASLP
jgi:hypothetical protein